MSVYVEHNHHNNFSHCLPTCENIQSLDNINNPITKVVKTLSIWNARAKQRKQLALLDDRLLADIGLNYADVKMELAKPFWK